jgi:hypothetical protein
VKNSHLPEKKEKTQFRHKRPKSGTDERGKKY